jgi:hypothetical protein
MKMKRMIGMAVIALATWIGTSRPAPADPLGDPVCPICGTEAAPCYYWFSSYCVGPEGVPACVSLEECFGG